MRRALLLMALVVIGGFFSGCAATRDWVQETLKESVDTLKTESKGALDTVMANLMSSLKDQGKKLLADLPGIAKGAAQSLLDAAEKKRKELQAKEIVKINVKLDDLVPDLVYDANKDGKVTCEDFLNEAGDLSPAATLRFLLYCKDRPAKEGKTKDTNGLLLAVGALGLLGVGGVAGSAAQKKMAGKTAAPPKTS
jgi:hypothetical protein